MRIDHIRRKLSFYLCMATDVKGDHHVHVVVQVASSSGLWQHVSFTLNGQHSGNPDAPLLEFVITDTGTLWDKQADGAQHGCDRTQTLRQMCTARRIAPHPKPRLALL